MNPLRKLDEATLLEEGPHTITLLLQRHHQGETGAFDELMQTIYGQLIAMARRQLKGMGGNTITPTVLVHELFLKMKPQRSFTPPIRAVFFSVAAKCMRQVLIDLIRRKRATKRGGEVVHVQLHEDLQALGLSDERLEVLNTAIEKLSRIDDGLFKVVEFRYLVGLSVEETASLLKISPTSVKRRWTAARAWLQHELAAEKDGSRP